MNGIEGKANRLIEFLNRLKSFAQELHLEAEKKSFETVENTVNEARDKVKEAKRKEKTEAEARKTAREEAERKEKEQREKKQREDRDREEERQRREEQERKTEEERKQREAQEKSDQEAREREAERLRKEEEEKRKQSESQKENEKEDQKDNSQENQDEKPKEQDPKPEDNGNTCNSDAAYDNFEGNENVEFLEIDVDEEQFIEGFQNFEAMFNGNAPPNMDAFDQVMESLLGNGKDNNAFEDNLYNGDYDSEIEFGRDYMIGSYEYRDEKYDVQMDVGRIMTVTTKQVDSMDPNELGDTDVMNLRGIKVVDETGAIELTLNNGMEKVIIRSSVKSLENYGTQRKLEEKIFLRIRTQGSPNVDPENLPIWGMEKKEASWIRKVGSIVADFMPYVGTSKAVSELIFGYDYIGGEEISRVVAACAVMGSLVPVPGAAKGMKYVGKWVNQAIKNGPDLAKKMPTRFHMRAPEETAKLRNEFDKTIRKKYIKEYASSKEAIKKFNVEEIEILKTGDTPTGWTVHHKKPLFKGGTNEFSNLRVMKKNIHTKYSKRLHYYEKGKNIYGFD